jgi:hypothetical protein
MDQPGLHTCMVGIRPHVPFRNLQEVGTRSECKALGAQEPQCTNGYMRISSTEQRGNRAA